MHTSINAAAYWRALRKAGVPRLLSMAIVFDAVRRAHAGQLDFDFFQDKAPSAKVRRVAA